MSRQQCVSVLEKNKCNNILSYAVCLLPFLRWRRRRRRGRHSLSCVALPLPDHCAKFPGSGARDDQDSIADDERFVLCPSWELVS